MIRPYRHSLGKVDIDSQMLEYLLLSLIDHNFPKRWVSLTG
jgi:hypothetical protein